MHDEFNCSFYSKCAINQIKTTFNKKNIKRQCENKEGIKFAKYFREY